MVLKGGFGFHIKDIQQRFGPETLVTFNKVRYSIPIRSSPIEPTIA